MYFFQLLSTFDQQCVGVLVLCFIYVLLIHKKNYMFCVIYFNYM